MLLGESGIAPEIVGGRGYRSVSRAEVPEDFADYQRRNGLLIPLYSPDGTTTGYQLRPDRPRRDKRRKPIRYETPTGGRIIADVHPRMLGAVADPSVPLWITEGAKKGDALASRGRCTVSLIGVWMYRAPKTADMLPCFDHVALAGRRVFVVYDSDVTTKPEVAMALERLVGDLENRGARPLIVYLPDAPDGGKLGVDDYLAAGGSVERLEETARPFDPADAARERMDRDVPLRDRIAALWRVWRAGPWRGTGAHSRREVLRAMIEDATRKGEMVKGGLRVPGALRPLVERTGVSLKAVRNALANLERDGYIKRDRRKARAADSPAYYVLLTPTPEGRARGTHDGKKGGGREGQRGAQGERRAGGGSDPGVCPMRAPHAPAGNPLNEWVFGEIKRLRWGYVARQYAPGRRAYDYVYIERLGKIAGRVLEALVEMGGEATAAELAEAVGAKRVRDLRRRQIVRLQDAGIVAVIGDTVRVTDDWAEKLGLARMLGGEYEAERLTHARHRKGRKAYRDHLAGKNKADRAPTEEEMDADPRREHRLRRQRVDVLVYQGMRCDRAMREVFGADGFIGDLATERAPDPPGADHPLSCECLDCSVTVRRYATPSGAGGAA
jgi:hypothetical protein